MKDIPENLVNALTAVVPTVDKSGKKNLKIFIYKNDKDNKAHNIVQNNTEGNYKPIRQIPTGRIDYANRIAKLMQANEIASNNLHDTGGNTIPL